MMPSQNCAQNRRKNWQTDSWMLILLNVLSLTLWLEKNLYFISSEQKVQNEKKQKNRPGVWFSLKTTFTVSTFLCLFWSWFVFWGFFVGSFVILGYAISYKYQVPFFCILVPKNLLRFWRVLQHTCFNS